MSTRTRRTNKIGRLLHEIVAPADLHGTRQRALHLCIVIGDKFDLWSDLRRKADERDAEILARITS